MIRATTITFAAFLFWLAPQASKTNQSGLIDKVVSVSPDSTGFTSEDKFPDITFLDTEGKEVRIKDFKGKYIYIDVWASWCYPCRREYPALKALRERLKDKAIVFVGISCDAGEIRWKGALRDEKMDGIQWILKKGDRSFMSFFKIATIPRYILVDRKGKIINPDIERPSNPKTEESLKALNM